MADVKQRVKIEQVADVSSVLEGIKKIQDALGKLALPQDTQDGFNRLFSNVEKQAEKASKAMASGFKTKGSVSAYTTALNQIVNIYDELDRKIKRLSNDKISLGADSGSFDKVNTRIKELNTEITSLEGNIKKLKNLKSIDNLGSKTGNKVGSWDTLIKAYKDGDIDKATKALKTLKGLLTKHDTDADFSKTTNWEAFRKDYETASIKVEELRKAQEGLILAESELNTKRAESAQFAQKGADVLEEANKAAEEGTKNSKQYARAQSQAAEETQQLNSELEHFKNKAAYFFGIANGINLLKRAIRSAYDTVKDLDAVMTETAVVTDFDVGDMWAQLPEYTQRANELGVSIHSAYEAATIFYQQGLKTNEVMAVSNETLKMARIAGLDAATASDRMTNALRGFNMEMDKVSAQRVNDVYSKLAAITASNTDEISTAMTKVASLAHNANMEFETTAAFLAQIIESTRESAETAGTALKTVVARFSEVKKLYSKGDLIGTDEEGEEIDVNRVATALRSAGINLNEYLTGAKGLDDIFIELAEKWDSLDIVQQRYIATMAAGSRQQSRFIALMSDYKRTVELVEAANNANGASQEQYGKTLDSLETKLARLKNAWNEFVLGLANSDAIKGAVDLLTGLITAINKLINLISGKNSGAKMITSFFAAFAGFKIGQKAIGKSGALTGFFGKLVGDNEAVAQGSAAKIAQSFYSNLANKISNFEKNGGLSSSLSGFFNKKIDSINGYFQGGMTSDIRRRIWSQLDPSASPEQLGNIQNVLKQDNVSIAELNQTLAQNGQSFQITRENAREFGVTLEDNNEIIGGSASNMRVLATASLAVGGALMVVGNQLEKTDEFKGFGTVIKTIGVALISFGTIMSVYLPLQAQLMAKGVTSAIVSIPIVGWIAAIVSALIALGTAIYKFSKDNSLENRLEKASTDLKNATTAAEDAKEAYEKLGEAWEDLSTKYDIIENATKGTQAWRDAVKETNDAVLELANTYEDVQIRRDEEGILHVTNKEDVDKKRADRVTETEAGVRVAQIRNLGLEQEKLYSELRDSISDDIIAEDLQRGGDLEKLFDKTVEEIQKIGEKYEYNISESDAKILQEYARKNATLQENISTQKEVLGSTVISQAGLSGELGRYANALMGDEFLDKVYEKATEEIRGTYNDTDIKNKYATKQGYNNYAEFKAKNPEAAKELSIDQMRDYLIGAAAIEKASDQLTIFSNNINKLNEEEKALFAGRSGSGLTQNQLTKLRGMDNHALYTRLGGDAVYGEGGEELFRQWLGDSLKAATANFDTSRFSADFQARLNQDLIGNLSSGTFKSFTDNLWSIYTTSGEQGMKQVQDSIAKMAAGVKPEDLDGFIKSINSVDWASADSIKTLDDLAKQYGISEEVVKSLEQQIIELNNATSKIDFEKISSILGLIKKISTGAQGRDFSEEDYNNLISRGVSKENFSYNIETGKYDYIGKNLQDITGAIMASIQDSIKSSTKIAAASGAVDSAKKTFGEVDVTNTTSLSKFLSGYIESAGGNSLIDRSVLTGNLEQMQAAYYKIVEAAAQSVDAQEEIERLKAQYNQLNNGAGNAADAWRGEEGAADALKDKVVNSGLPEEVAQQFIWGINSGLKHYIEEAGSVVDTLKQAEQFGIDPQTLNSYVDALRQIKGLEDARIDTLYALAAANARYQDGFKKIIDSYDEWIKLKKEDGSIAPNENLDQIKAYEQLKKNLKEMFNLSEDISDEFLKSADNVDLMEKAVKGDTKAVSQLRANLAKTNLNVSIDSKNKSEIESYIDKMTQEASTLEFGATLDDSQFALGLKNLMEQAGMTVADMEKVFKSLGWAPEITYETVDVADIQRTNTTGYQEIIVDEKGTKKTVPINGISEYAVEGKVRIPKFGNATFTKPSMPSTSSSKKKSSGGGGGSKKKATYWENPYDELYNLQEKINEALRTREALERRYQKLLKQEQATLADIRKSYYAQITNLRGEADLQKQFAQGRLRQISELGNKIYTDDNGNRKSFNSLGVTKYASYNAETGLITIDWEGLDAISKSSSRVNEGKAAEAYISKLEELVKSYEDVRDKLWDIEDEIESLREAAIESYLSFEDRVMEALVNKYQQEIDSYQSMSDAIDKANSEVIDSLREQVDLSRQIRDNTEKEKEISDMENRLAYLQRDTSGANALEVQKLQKEIEDAREGYTDELVDQAIDKMQNDANLAAEQRARQIETMQEQLEIMKDTGALWQQVYDLIDEAAAGDGALSSYSNLVELLKGTEAFASLSNIGQAKWWSEVAEEFHSAWVGRGEAEDKYKTDANNDGTIYNSNTSKAIEEVTQPTTTTTTTAQPAQTATTTKSGYTDKQKYGVALAICEGYWGNGDTRVKNLKAKGFNPSEIQAIVNKVYKDAMSGAWYGKYYGIKDLSAYKMSKFKQGGLADFTGPAWLDGTKTRPEIVLNAKDSANFIALRDILSSLLNNSGANGGAIGGTKQINVDVQANISSDYDVDRLVNRVKEDIYNDGSYRTNNSINFLR